jgi:hypothetical protein
MGIALLLAGLGFAILTFRALVPAQNQAGNPEQAPETAVVGV